MSGDRSAKIEFAVGFMISNGSFLSVEHVFGKFGANRMEFRERMAARDLESKSFGAGETGEG